MAIRDISDSVRIEKEVVQMAREVAKAEGRLLTYVLSRLIVLGLAAHKKGAKL